MQRSIHIPLRLRPEYARAELIPRIIKLATQKIAMQCLRGIVLRTPVDTGRARSNWHVSLDVPVLTEIGPWQAGAQLGIGETGNASATIEIGAQTIRSAPAFGVIYISNGLPYINRLEHGWSKQAPAGMVRLTLDQVASQFQ